MSGTAPEAWACAAATLPLAFSQVREDPAVDETVLRALGAPARIWMIASGGDTAAWLAATGLASQLHLVDGNAAQLALTRLKLQLLGEADEATRLGVLGHRRRANRLAGWLPEPGVLGPPDLLESQGPDFAGRYEALFAQLRAERGRSGEAAAFAAVFRLENLVCLFGEAATQNARVSFAEHFLERTHWARAHLPPADHAYLEQMLEGKFQGGRHYRWHRAAPPTYWPALEYEHAPAAAALRAAPVSGYDFVHLSNILDWLSAAEAGEMLALAARALRPGGRVLIRQLNSSTDIPGASRAFRWHETAALHRADTSFFYRALHLGEAGVNVRLLHEAPAPPLAAALAEFEQAFRYPLGAEATFHISHGADYPLFFRAIGPAACAVAQDERGGVCGTLSVALRDLLLPSGEVRRAAYLADLKICPGTARGRVLLGLSAAVTRWALAAGATCGYAVVMQGTARRPTRYTGRLGIHPFRPMAEIALFRVAAQPAPPRSEFETMELDPAFRQLSAGRWAPLGGHPALRSRRPPQALMTPEGDACGRLEDTQRAKRLWLTDGSELRSAHLSSFAYRSPAAGLRLLREALARGAPEALFFAVPAGEAEAFRGPLAAEPPARATIFAAELEPSPAPWNIATSEI